MKFAGVEFNFKNTALKRREKLFGFQIWSKYQFSRQILPTQICAKIILFNYHPFLFQKFIFLTKKRQIFHFRRIQKANFNFHFNIFMLDVKISVSKIFKYRGNILTQNFNPDLTWLRRQSRLGEFYGTLILVIKWFKFKSEPRKKLKISEFWRNDKIKIFSGFNLLKPLHLENPSHSSILTQKNYISQKCLEKNFWHKNSRLVWVKN